MNRCDIFAIAIAAVVGCEAEPVSIGPERLPAPMVSRALPPPKPPVPEWKMLADRWVHPNPIPNFELTDQNGEAFRLRDLSHGHLLVGLIFTHCSVPTACPRTTQKMYDTAKLWAARAEAGETGDGELRFLTLTFDPEADTPDVLKKYGSLMLADFGDSWTLATGPVELMEKTLPGMFGVIARESGDTITHTVKAALLGPGLRPVREWKNNSFEPAEVVALVLR